MLAPLYSVSNSTGGAPTQANSRVAVCLSSASWPFSKFRLQRGRVPIRRSGPDHVDGGQWAVETHGLTKRFGENIAVNDVELLVPRGCAFGYLGPNGAGKTTLIRVLLGLTHADAGTMFLLGHAVPRHRDVALARVGAIVDEPRFHGHLTGRQNLQILAAAREPAAKGRIAPALERVGILHRADDKVSKYSMGMRQRLGVAACLLGDPQLLILDEPMNGLDPAGMLDMRDMIKSLVSEGRTVVLSSHLLDEVERTCDAVAIVDRGKVIRQGPISQLLAGSSFEVQVECSDPDRARRLLDGTTFGAHVQVGPDGSPSPCRRAPSATPSRRSTACWSRGDLGVPAPAHPGLARAVVPRGDQPIGSIRMTTISDIGAPVRVRLPLRSRRKRGAITAARGSRRGAWSPRASWSCASGGD
jgi:ABC-2 type transport system ATP-binding protein